jgi:hypothetical protein
VSNFRVEHLNDLAATASVLPAVNQAQMYVGLHDDASIARCAELNITYESYSPLGPYHQKKPVLEDKRVAAIAKAHNVSSAEVGMRWIVQSGHPLVTASAEKEYDVQDVSGVFAFELTPSEMAQLAAIKHPHPAEHVAQINADTTDSSQRDFARSPISSSWSWERLQTFTYGSNSSCCSIDKMPCNCSAGTIPSGIDSAAEVAWKLKYDLVMIDNSGGTGISAEANCSESSNFESCNRLKSIAASQVRPITFRRRTVRVKLKLTFNSDSLRLIQRRACTAHPSSHMFLHAFTFICRSKGLIPPSRLQCTARRWVRPYLCRLIILR